MVTLVTRVGSACQYAAAPSWTSMLPGLLSLSRQLAVPPLAAEPPRPEGSLPPVVVGAAAGPPLAVLPHAPNASAMASILPRCSRDQQVAFRLRAVGRSAVVSRLRSDHIRSQLRQQVTQPLRSQLGTSPAGCKIADLSSSLNATANLAHGQPGICFCA